MKYLLVLLLGITSSVWASTFYEKEFDPNTDIGDCNTYRKAELETANSDVEQLLNFAEDNFLDVPPNFCSEDQVHGKTGVTDPAERKQRIKDLTKQCRKKAGAFKRAVFKDMIFGDKKDKNFLHAIQALFKRKSKLYDTNMSSRSLGELEINVEDLKKLSPEDAEEFSQEMINYLENNVEGIKDFVDKHHNSKNAFRGSDSVTSYPLSLTMKTEAGETCIVKATDLPELPEPDYKCLHCTNTEQQNNFTNDCSYMVNKNVTIGDKVLDDDYARDLMSAGDRYSLNGEPDGYCQKSKDEMNKTENKMDEILDVYDKLCALAETDKVPSFKIESSRNLYSDETPQLALKRGKFTQKFLYEKLKAECVPKLVANGKAVPGWLDENEFKQHVEVHMPKYERPNNVAGNYGPKPDATPEEQEKEKKYLRETLKLERDDIKKQKDYYENEIAAIDKKINIEYEEGKVGLLALIQAAEQNYNSIKEFIVTGDNDQKIVDQKDLALSEASGHYADLKTSLYRLKQKRFEYEEKKNSFKQILESPKYAKDELGEFVIVNKLDEFYKSNVPQTGSLREDWDKKLFNQFKMARISGGVDDESDPFSGIPNYLINHKLSRYLNAMVELESFDCEIKPFETKSAKGVRVGLQIATAVTMPVIAPLAGVGYLVGKGIKGIAKGIKCLVTSKSDCKTPGFHYKAKGYRNKHSRRGNKGFLANLALNIKNGVKEWITWGGILEVKGSKVKTHTLKAYIKKMGIEWKNAKDKDILKAIDLIEADMEKKSKQVAQVSQACEYDPRDMNKDPSFTSDAKEESTSSGAVREGENSDNGN